MDKLFSELTVPLKPKSPKGFLLTCFLFLFMVYLDHGFVHRDVALSV